EEGQKMMARLMAWMEGMGTAVVDKGNAAKVSKTVSAAGIADNGGANPVSGYSLVSADTFESALEMARKCPIIEDGGSVEVAEAMEM
ncbi:MAG: hypothetical protein ACC631_06420, partial [Halocynthiibacter sp.]